MMKDIVYDLSHNYEYKRNRILANRVLKNKSTRHAVFTRNGYRCVLCGNIKHLSIDHIISVYKGGDSDLNNLQTVCQHCNSAKLP
jgi:5-methylcytosine-specific restriction endonuclease McrA